MPTTNHDTVVARGRLGAAIRNGDEEAAADAARELARIRRRITIAKMEERLGELRQHEAESS